MQELIEKFRVHLLPMCHKRSALERYLKIVETFLPLTQSKAREKGSGIERHHILPVSLFKEYEKCGWNKVDFPSRVHYIAHGLLVQITRSPQMIFAFNNMRRVCGGRSAFYPLVRALLSEAVSKCNTGRSCSEELKKYLSETHKGTVLVKDPNFPEDLFKVSVEDQRYISGELVFFRLGEKQTDQCKKNISESNKGKICLYHAESEGVRYAWSEQEASELEKIGFLRGTRPSSKRLLSEIISNMVWIHHPVTKEVIRADSSSPLPEGFVAGRGEFNNVGAVIGGRWLCVYDIDELRKTKIAPESIYPTRHIVAATHRDVKKIFLFNDLVSVTSKSLHSNFAMCGVYVPEFNQETHDENYVVPALNGREKTKELKEFRKKFCGISMKQLGLKVICMSTISAEELDLVKQCLRASV